MIDSLDEQDFMAPDKELSALLEELFKKAAMGIMAPSGQHRFVTPEKKQPSGRIVRERIAINATSYTHWRRANWPNYGLGHQISLTERLLGICTGRNFHDDEAMGLSQDDGFQVFQFWQEKYETERSAAVSALQEYLEDLRRERAKQNDAQGDARLTRATDALAAKSKSRRSQVVSGKPIAILKPGSTCVEMLRHFPPELAEQWRQRTIDGAIEILACPRGRDLYGGFEFNQIICETHDKEWPEDFGKISDLKLSNFASGLIGNDAGVRGWLKQKSTPSRIRVLCAPISPPVLDRPEITISLGNSDYFAVRTVTELSRLNQEAAGPALNELFPRRWAKGLSEDVFDVEYIPYHVSAQAVVMCRSDDKLYLLLGSVNSGHASLTSGWGATIAEQMWAPDRRRIEEPWWFEFAKDRLAIVRKSETRSGDEHIRETLSRGLSEELGIRMDRDTIQDPVLLNAAIEEHMYFVTFIFAVFVDIDLREMHHRWSHAPDHNELGLLAAYQLTGADASGQNFDGPKRLAELLSKDIFDAGPYLLPQAIEPGKIIGPWHCSSRLRMYAAGMHLWPEEFPKYVRIIT